MPASPSSSQPFAVSHALALLLRYGTIFGTLNVASNAGAACGPWITGVLYDATGTYKSAFVCAMVMSLIAIMAMWVAAPRKVRVVASPIQG
jgi:predicted MFS family arabinose efflux permease